MKIFKIVAITQVYNELEKGNLLRFFKYIKNSADELVVYDDCSTDGTYEYAKKNTQLVLRGLKNDFTSEIKHKQILLETALSLKPDFTPFPFRDLQAIFLTFITQISSCKLFS